MQSFVSGELLLLNELAIRGNNAHNDVALRIQEGPVHGSSHPDWAGTAEQDSAAFGPTGLNSP